MVKEVRVRRKSVFWHFGKTGNNCGKGDDDDAMGGGRITRSSVAGEAEDWTIDMDAANCDVTQIRRLDRYSLEHILTIPPTVNKHGSFNRTNSP